MLLQIIYMSNQDEFTADLLQGTLDLLVLKALAAQNGAPCVTDDETTVSPARLTAAAKLRWS